MFIYVFKNIEMLDKKFKTLSTVLKMHNIIITIEYLTIVFILASQL